ncbi:MAG: hypothetical protein J6A59_18320 [Lachnospiraceae bacterium]|nr:hypothetical protein [Lachnospiraceae bacterium]
MKLYNVSFDLNNTNQILKPCIPYSVAADEDKTIPRVCLAKSPAHCMQAIATDTRQVYVGSNFILRTVDIKEDSDYIINPQVLFDRKYVPDALENLEYWSLKPVKCKVQHCVIEYFDYEREIAWSCIKLEDCWRIIKRFSGKEFNRCKSAKTMYNAFSNWATENKQWEMLDDVWDTIAMLPWAQTTKIYNLKYRVL